MALTGQEKSDLVQQVLDEVSRNVELNFQTNPTRALRWVIDRSIDVGYDAFGSTWGVLDPEVPGPGNAVEPRNGSPADPYHTQS